MKIVQLLLLVGLLGSQLNAGKLISDFDPDEECNEIWNQFYRMQSMGDRNDIALDIRVRHIANYISDIKNRIKSIEMKKTISKPQIERLWLEVLPYENYEKDYHEIIHRERGFSEHPLQPFYRSPNLPADDDLPSFSDDGDWDRDDEEQDQENDENDDN